MAGGDATGTLERHAFPAARERRARRYLLPGLVLAATLLVVYVNRHDVPAAIHAVGGLRPGWGVAAAALGVAGLLALAVEHYWAQVAAGLRPRFRSIAPVALSAKFLNLVAKSGGLAGVVAFRRAAPPESEGQATAAYLLVTVLDPLAFAAVLVAAMALVAAQGRMTGADRVALLIFVGYLGVTVAGFTAAARSRRAVRALYGLPARVRRKAPDHEHADELFDAVAALRTAPRSLLAPALTALGVDLVGAAQLWVVLVALGAHVGAGQALVAYAVSTLFGIVGFVPGGLGVVEVSLGAVLASFGVAVGVAAAAVVLYRVLEFWLPLGVGAAAARGLAGVAA